jgi:hypothetical protein
VSAAVTGVTARKGRGDASAYARQTPRDAKPDRVLSLLGGQIS